MLPLLKPSRYKAAFGGRGGTKSHFFASQIVLRCYQKKTRVVCIREVQVTIRDSVRQLIVDKIQAMGLGAFFQVLEGEIRGRNGSLIVFKGMQNYNAHNIKSLEDFDIAFVEEAQTLSDDSLRLLRPTIRKDGSELWFAWNPRHESDPVDAFFRGSQPPPNAIIVQVNWYDNPWFPEVLHAEKDADFANDPDMAEHVWGGGYERITEAAYYARHIAAAEKEGRVGFIPHDPRHPVMTSWDIGVDDYTSVWFMQHIHPWVNVIDYYEASGLGADECLAEALPEYSKDEATGRAKLIEIGRPHPFKYKRHYFPHDIRAREWGAGARTRVQTLVGLGVPLNTINVGVAQNPEERINASRRLLPIVRFSQTKRVMLGLQRLRRYSRKRNELLGTYGAPLHDENSHGSDAFGEFAVNCGIVAPPKAPAQPANPKGIADMTYDQALDRLTPQSDGGRI
jgi:phage terminase large subunit